MLRILDNLFKRQVMICIKNLINQAEGPRTCRLLVNSLLFLRLLEQLQEGLLNIEILVLLMGPGGTLAPKEV